MRGSIRTVKMPVIDGPALPAGSGRAGWPPRPLPASPTPPHHPLRPPRRQPRVLAADSAWSMCENAASRHTLPPYAPRASDDRRQSKTQVMGNSCVVFTVAFTDAFTVIPFPFSSPFFLFPGDPFPFGSLVLRNRSSPWPTSAASLAGQMLWCSPSAYIYLCAASSTAKAEAIGGLDAGQRTLAAVRCTLLPSHLAWPRSRLDTWNRPISDTRMIQLARRDWTKRGLPCHTKVPCVWAWAWAWARARAWASTTIHLPWRPNPVSLKGNGELGRPGLGGRTGVETDCPGIQGGVVHHGRGVVSHVAIRTPDRATSRVRLSSIHSRLGPAARSQQQQQQHVPVLHALPLRLDTPELPFVLVVAVAVDAAGELGSKN